MSDAVVYVTNFDSLTHTRGQGSMLSAEDMLGGLTSRCARPLVTAAKETLPLWSPVAFAGGQRSRAGVTLVYALVLDYDAPGSTLNAVGRVWSDYTGLAHTSWSHGATDLHGEPCAARECCRVVLPLARPVTAAEYPALWRWAADRSAAAGLPVDPHARDASRAWYVPARHPDRASVAHVLLGGGSAAWLGPDGPLAVSAPEALPPPPPTSPGVRTAPPSAATGPRPGVPSPAGALAFAVAHAAELAPSVAGQGGDVSLYNAACTLRRGYALTEADAMAALVAFNTRCQPPWPPTRLRHKAREAAHAEHPAWGALLPPPPDGADEGPARGGRRAVLTFEALARAVAGARPGLAYDSFLRAGHDGAAALDDAYVLRLRHELSRRGLEAPTREVWEAAALVARQRAHHSLQESLRTLPPWDGTPRLEQAAATYLGVDDTEQPLACVLLRKWLVSAVARAMSPGCQADCVLVLQGPQGAGKTSFFRIVAGPGKYLSLSDVGTKDALCDLLGKWVAEIEELDKLAGKRDAATVKAFVSQTHRTWRKPFERASDTVAACEVFGATTNRLEFLSDPTGARRWWPVVTRGVDVPALARDRDQLVAEALRAYDDGAEWHLAREESALLDDRHELHAATDARVDVVLASLERGEVVAPDGRGLRAADVGRVALRCDASAFKADEQRVVAEALRRAGYERKVVRLGKGSRETRWVRSQVST